jgi:CDP-diacylglycerol---serine O-phosphatidyltransferase
MKLKFRRAGPPKKRLRRVAVVPALFTLANGVCGFAAIVFASRIHPEAMLSPAAQGWQEALGFLQISGWLIFAGMVFDVLDGRVARQYNATSRFGAELDSLCDVVTFGVAPAFLLLKMGPAKAETLFMDWFLYRLLFVVAGFYVVCTIVRLARFNVETSADEDSHRFFKGLPSPAAAGCLASFAVLRHDAYDYGRPFGVAPETLHPWIDAAAMAMPFGAFAVAALMVSNAKYPHLVNHSLRGRQSFRRLVALLAVVALFALAFTAAALALAFWCFAFVMPLKHGNFAHPEDPGLPAGAAPEAPPGPDSPRRRTAEGDG